MGLSQDRIKCKITDTLRYFGLDCYLNTNELTCLNMAIQIIVAEACREEYKDTASEYLKILGRGLDNLNKDHQ